MPDSSNPADQTTASDEGADASASAKAAQTRLARRWSSRQVLERMRQFGRKLRENARWMKTFLHGGRQAARTRIQPTETLRWPTPLDRGEIVSRLVEIRETGRISELTLRFANVERMPPAQLGACVIHAMTWLQDKPQYRPVSEKIQMIALNMKNLK